MIQLADEQANELIYKQEYFMFQDEIDMHNEVRAKMDQIREQEEQKRAEIAERRK